MFSHLSHPPNEGCNNLIVVQELKIPVNYTGESRFCWGGVMRLRKSSVTPPVFLSAHKGFVQHLSSA